jgi:Tol biopolymer transport system component/DNA-binding winged helix-turn-helix (wHTH) protein
VLSSPSPPIQSRALQHTFRLGEAYHVEPSLNRVTGPGGTSRLEPKMMLVLVCLADHAGQVVTKDRLLHSAWPDTAVGDDVLTRAISELRRLFEDDPKQPHVIETIPKSGYRLIASVEVLAAHHDAAPAVAPRAAVSLQRGRDTGTGSEARETERWSRRLVAAGVLGVVGLAVAGAWYLRSPRTPAPPAMRVVALTALSGSEYGGAFSPDGRLVAFSWNGEVSAGGTRPWWQGNMDIYIKAVGSSEVRRLTTDPGTDLAPQWSPDGRQIAYARSEPPYHSQTIRVMSALGGSDRKVSDFHIWLPAAWSPDGRYVVAGRAGQPEAAYPTNGIYLIPIQGGVPRAITRPPAPGVDHAPAFSPDGRRLAYASCPQWRGECRVAVLDLDAAFQAVGPPRQLTGLQGGTAGVSWSRDGHFIIFDADEVQLGYLWRVAADGSGLQERIEVAGANARYPYIAPAGDRLAFTRTLRDEDVYQFEPGRSARPIARSSVFDGVPEFSPDGTRIAFCSLRSGDAMEVWVANADGSQPQQLTHGPSRFQGGPSWSPDGKRVAFESQAADGHPHIWTVDSDGGVPGQVTHGAGDQMTPAWSRDGESVYFSWSQTSGRDIWRTRIRTGATERVTHGGGFLARESADGKTLIYLSKPGYSPVLAQPLAGGAPRQIIPCVAGTAVAVHPTGIYYLPCSGSPPDRDPLARLMDLATGKVRDLGRLENFQYESLPSGFAVSPDSRTILYGRLVRDEADLMSIENFR